MAAPKASPSKWMTISQLAEARGVGKSAVSRRVSRMQAAGLLDVRRDGGSKLVNVADFERAILISTDAVRESNGSKSKGRRAHSAASDGSGLSLAAEQARRTKLQADLAEMEVARRRGELILVEDVRFACSRAGALVAQKLDALHIYSGEMTEIVRRDGERGLREYLKRQIRTIREEFAHALTQLAASDDE